MLTLIKIVTQMVVLNFTKEDALYLLTQVKAGRIKVSTLFSSIEMPMPEDVLLTDFVDVLHKPNAIESVVHTGFLSLRLPRGLTKCE